MKTSLLPAAAALLLAGTAAAPVRSAGAGTDPADRRNRHGQRHRRRTGLRPDLQGDGRRPRRPARHRQPQTQPDGHRLHRHPQHVVRLPRHSAGAVADPGAQRPRSRLHGGGVRDDPRRRLPGLRPEQDPGTDRRPRHALPPHAGRAARPLGNRTFFRILRPNWQNSSTARPTTSRPSRAANWWPTR